MAVVYADSPGAAFAQNAALDQQRVSNYLQSIEANRRAQLQQWNAAASIAQANQLERLRRDQQMADVAYALINRRQRAAENAQQRADSAAVNQANLKLAERQQQLDLMRMVAPLITKKTEQAKADTDYDAETERMVEALNQNLAIGKLRGQLTPERVDAMVAAATPAGGFLGIKPGKRRQGREDTMRDITGIVANLPADFSNVEATPDAFRQEALRAIGQQETNLRPTVPEPRDSSGRVQFNPQTGLYEPVLLRTRTPSPAPNAMPEPSNAAVAQPAAAPTQPGAEQGPLVFRTASEARASGVTPGQKFYLWDPATFQYRLARLTQ